MTIKDFIRSRLQLYFFLVTLILTADFIIGSMFDPNRQLSNIDLTGPLILAGLCIRPTFVTYFKDEPNSRQLIIRRVIQFALIEAIVQLAAAPGVSIENKVQFRITTALLVLVIYLLAFAVISFRSFMESKQLTKLLKEYQENA